MMRQVEAGSGYASEMMLPLHFGLGKAEQVNRIEIRWPSGRVQHLDGEKITALTKGSLRMRIEEGSDSLQEIAVVQKR